jgi:hypothetical protein
MMFLAPIAIHGDSGDGVCSFTTLANIAQNIPTLWLDSLTDPEASRHPKFREVPSGSIPIARENPHVKGALLPYFSP